MTEHLTDRLINASVGIAVGLIYLGIVRLWRWSKQKKAKL